ncbi:MAG: ATP-binding protein, partial [Rhodospirillaceae bacterium]|nr:ATP-binding protein [Rhodospirillaceae bacterium]
MAHLRREPAAFSPTLWAEDAEAEHWLRQATLRLRRETAWRWHLAERPGSPRAGDRLMESLDLTRYADEKRAFFAEDVTARYLAEQMRPPPRAIEGEPPRGGFAWAARTLALDEAARLALGIALLAGLDSAAGPVIAGCHGDGSGMLPTLGLVQRLWDRPEEVSALADPQHPLW